MNSEIERLDFGSDPSWEIVKRQFFNTGDRIAVAFEDRKGGRIQVSEAALNALKNPMYGLVLINPKRHQLMLMGSNTKVPNCIELRTRDDNSVNGTISGGPFVNRLWNLMEWKPGRRYTVFGNLAPVRLVNDEPTLVFDLEDSCMSDSYKRKGAKQYERKQPHPADHSEQFGLGVRAEELLQG